MKTRRSHSSRENPTTTSHSVDPRRPSLHGDLHRRVERETALLGRDRLQLDLERRVVRWLAALAVSVVDVAAGDVRGQVLARQGQVDAQAVVARVVTVALVPAGEPALLRVQTPVDVDELALFDDLAHALALGRASVRGVFQPGRLVHVLIAGRDVEVAGDQHRALLLAVDLAGHRLQERELSLGVGLLLERAGGHVYGAN